MNNKISNPLAGLQTTTQKVSVAILCAVFLMAFGCGSLTSSEENDLMGTKWKLISIGALKEIEPKSCEECFMLEFLKGCCGADSELKPVIYGRAASNYFCASFEVDYAKGKILFDPLFGKMIAETPHGNLYVNALGTVHSFSQKKKELRLYYTDKRKDYLLFKQL